MKYPHLSATVPQGEHFDSSAVNEGVWLTAAHIDSIEASLATNAELVISNSNSAETISGLNTAASDNATTISTQAARIQELEAQVVELGGKASGNGSVLVVKEDEHTDKTPVPAYLDDNNEFNQWVDKQTKRSTKK